MEGLYRAMETEGIRIDGEEILLLGAGGASRAVAYLCAVKGAERVYLLNRTLDKAERVAKEVNDAAGRHAEVKSEQWTNCRYNPCRAPS